MIHTLVLRPNRKIHFSVMAGLDLVKPGQDERV